MTEDDDGGTAALGRRIRQLRRRISQEGLSRRIGFHRTRISKAENGELPSADLCEALDDHWRTGGELAVWQARLEAAGDSGEEETTDRRQLVELAALSALAFETTRRIDNSGAAPTLGELEDDLDEIAASYDTAPHPVLIAQVAGRWRQVEAILDQRLSVTDGRRTTLLGGQLTYYLGRLAFMGGHYRDARRFCDLSDRYADQVGDDMLTGSLAALRSSVAYYTHRWDEAATAAARARRDAPPYLAGRLAAYEARSYARLGMRRETEVALAAMGDSASAVTVPRPGSSPFTPGSMAMFSAVCAIELDDGDGARRCARQAIDLIDPRSHEERSHAYLCLATGLLRQHRPDPGAAVAATRTAAAVPDGHLSATIVSAMTEVVRDLRPWASDPDVHALGALVRQSRLDLPGSPA